MPSILHARQPSPTTVYFVNAATPASSVNTATVVFTATLEYNTTHSQVVNVNCMCISFSCFVSRQTCSSLNIIYIISEETSILAPQRLRLYKALGVAACTVGKVRASTVFMCVCSMFRPSDFLLFVKNGFVVGVRCQGNREPPPDGATTPLSQRHSWLGSP